MPARELVPARECGDTSTWDFPVLVPDFDPLIRKAAFCSRKLVEATKLCEAVMPLENGK